MEGRAMRTGEKIAAILAMLVEQSGEQVSRERLKFMTSKLLEFEPEKVAAALERMLESARRFPTLAEIKAAMGVAEPQPKDWALLLSDKICQGISKYGEVVAGKTARSLEQALGPAAMALVARQGGWNACVDRAGENFGVFRAQIRTAAESLIMTGAIEVRPSDRTELPSLHQLVEGARMAEIESGGPPKLALVSGAKTIEVTTCTARGDMIVRLGAQRWSPVGALHQPTLQAPVTRRFDTWKAAAVWIAGEMGPHVETCLQQLVAARRALDSGREDEANG